MLGAGDGNNLESEDRSHEEDGSPDWTMLGAGDGDNWESEDRSHEEDGSADWTMTAGCIVLFIK